MCQFIPMYRCSYRSKQLGTMLRRSLPTAVVLACLMLAIPHAESAREVCVSLEERGQQLANSELSYVHVCPPEKGWNVLQLLWSPLNVDINCSSNSYTVLTASSMEQLEAGNGTAVRWCGLNNMLSEPNVCQFTLSPLHVQYVAVDTRPAGVFTGLSTIECKVDSWREASLRHMVLSMVGIALFFNAAKLTMSDTFRLTSGSLMFMSGAVLVLAFVLMRNMPYKRSLIAFFTISTSSMLAVVRWLYGTWMPDAYSLATSRPFIGYLIASGLLGWMVTYWMDDKSNVKLNTTIRVVLQLAALLLVYIGVADEGVAVAAVLLLLGSGVLRAIGRRCAQLTYFVGRSMLLLISWAARACHLVAIVAWRAALGSRKRPAAAAAAGEAGPSAVSSLRYAAGSPLPHDDDHDDDQLLSDEEQDRTAVVRRRHRQQAAATDRDPSLQDWQPARTRRVTGERSPLHYKHLPPLSPNVLACQPDLQQRSPRTWQQQQVAFGGARPAAGRAEDGVGYRFPSSTSPGPAPVSHVPARTPPSTSSWGHERVVVNLSTQAPSLPQAAAPVVSPHTAPVEQQPYGHPRIADNKIRNPLTGRDIALHGATYKSLLEKGYTPDWKGGVLVPPGGASAGPGGSSRLSPASNTRQRAPRSAAAR